MEMKGAILNDSIKNRECEFIRPPVCRLYTICIREGIGKHENSVNRCALYWKLKVERALKRLGICNVH